MPPLLWTVALVPVGTRQALRGPWPCRRICLPQDLCLQSRSRVRAYADRVPWRHRWPQDLRAASGSMVRVWGWEQVGMGSREFVDMGAILAEMSAWVFRGNWLAPWDRRRVVAKRLLAECWAGSSWTRYVSMGLLSEVGGPTAWLCTARTRHLASPRPREHWPAGDGRFREAVVDWMTCCHHRDDRITGWMAATKRR